MTNDQPSPRSPRHRLAIIAVWGSMSAVLTAAEPRRPLREQVTLPIDGQVAKSLFTVDEYLSEQRYDELTDLVLQLAETHHREVTAVPDSGTPMTNRYQNVPVYCQRLLAALPPEGRAICRQRLDGQARRWWDAWLTTRDPRHLERILNSAYISRYGDDALWALAEAAWDRGEFSLADSFWKQLSPLGEDHVSEGLAYPDPEFSPADVAARRLLCVIFSRQFTVADQKLRVFRQKFAAAEGSLAGQQGRLADILTEVLADAQTWTPPETIAEMTTFGGARERQRQWPVKLDVGALRWTSGWPVRNLPQIGARTVLDRGALRMFPVTDGERVFIHDGDFVRAWNLLTGEPAWPNDPPDSNIIYPTNPDQRLKLPTRPCVGTAWQTLTLHHGKLLARMGSPVTGAAGSELGNQISELVCLDVQTGQGKLLWKLTEADLPNDGPPWSFEGTPVVLEETAYIVLYRRFPEAEFALLAVDVDSGAIFWQQSLGAARPAVLDAVNRVSHLLLTAGEGRLYFSTEQGTILALSPQDGRLLWAVTYESQSPELLPGSPVHLQTGLLPPVFWNGRLCVAPNDSRFVFCLEAASGMILWQRRKPEPLRQLIGVADHDVRARLIAGGNSLWAFDLNDGGLAWRMTQSEPEERGYGQGLMTGGAVFWPTREYLFQLDQSTGELQRKIPLRTPDAAHFGGNLAVTDGLLLIAEPDRLSVYGEYSRLKEKHRIELSRRPDQPLVWQRLFELELSAGHWDDALLAGRKAWSLSAALNEPSRAELQAKFCEGLHRMIAHRIESDKLDEAVELFDELSALPLSPAERGRMCHTRAQLELQRQSPSQAAARWHDALALYYRSHFDLDGEPAQSVIVRNLKQIQQQHGREPFRALDALAEQHIAQAAAAGKGDDVRRVLRNFPLLESAPQVWQKLIHEAVQQRNWNAVWPLLDEWQAAAATDGERRVVDQQRLLALKAAGYSRSAALRTRQFSNPQGTAESVEPVSAPWHYLSRGWQRLFADDIRTVMPVSHPPANDLACVLLSGTELAAIDRRTGRTRWRQAVTSPVVWAGYGETLLLLASQDALSARRLETGELIWQQPREITDQQLTSAAIHTTRDRLLIFDRHKGVAAVSPVTGEPQWKFCPPRGSLQPHWTCTAERLIVQTLDPAEIWLVDTANGQLQATGPTAAEPWRQPPVALGGPRFGCVVGNLQVVGWGPERSQRWTYSQGISHAHTPPWLFGEQDRLYLILDGSTLVGVDPQRGRRLWGSGIADRPLADPSQQVAVSAGLAAAAANSLLRAVSLTDGQIAWEQSLPHGIETWRVIAENGCFAALGTDRQFTQLVMFRAADGHPVQTLRQAIATQPADWRLDEVGALCVSKTTLTAWQALSAVK